jgi:hypothetical protein
MLRITAIRRSAQVLEPLAWNVLVEQQNAHRQQQAYAAKQGYRSKRLNSATDSADALGNNRRANAAITSSRRLPTLTYFTAFSFSISSNRAWQ